MERVRLKVRLLLLHKGGRQNPVRLLNERGTPLPMLDPVHNDAEVLPSEMLQQNRPLCLHEIVSTPERHVRRQSALMHGQPSNRIVEIKRRRDKDGGRQRRRTS